MEFDNNIVFRKNSKEDMSSSAYISNSYSLQVPIITIKGFQDVDNDIESQLLIGENRKRSHSVSHLQTSGDSTPTRKFSSASVDTSKPALNSFSHITTLSSNFLNNSILNIRRSSSAKTLRDIFSPHGRRVKIFVMIKMSCNLMVDYIKICVYKHITYILSFQLL